MEIRERIQDKGMSRHARTLNPQDDAAPFIDTTPTVLLDRNRPYTPIGGNAVATMAWYVPVGPEFAYSRIDRRGFPHKADSKY
jgi:hypothetical protein